jgi:hypothetical protein
LLDRDSFEECSSKIKSAAFVCGRGILVNFHASAMSLLEERKPLSDPYSAVVVAVGIMRKVEVAVDEIIQVISVRNGFMAATGPMAMTRLMCLTTMSGRAGDRVRRAHGEDMLIHMVFMQVMKVPVVQVILMVLVVDDTVAAMRPVLVPVGVVNLMSGHALSSARSLVMSLEL